MAYAERLPSGRWRGGYRDSAGKRRYAPGTFPRKRDARDAAADAEAIARRQAATSRGTLSASTTWGDWWEAIRPEREKNMQSSTPRVEQDIAKRYLVPTWGEVPLNAITAKTSGNGQVPIQPWVDGLCRQGHKPAYVRRIYSVFRRSLVIACEQQVLSASPCVGVELPKIYKRAKPYISDDMAVPLVEHMDQPWADMLTIILETGMRPGEASGLHADAIDWTNRRINIGMVYVLHKDAMRPWPKDKDHRTLPLTEQGLDILRRNLGDRDGTCGVKHLDGTCKSPLVFVNPDGQAIKTNAFWQKVRTGANRAGIEHTYPYAARRGFATKLKDAGVDVITIASMMGHEDIRLVSEYAQTTPAAEQSVLRALGDAQPLRAVEPWGDIPARGTDRGTDFDNRPQPETIKPVDESGA